MYVHVRTCSLSSLSFFSRWHNLLYVWSVYFEGHRGKAGAIQRAPKDVAVLIRFLLTLIRSLLTLISSSL